MLPRHLARALRACLRRPPGGAVQSPQIEDVVGSGSGWLLGRPGPARPPKPMMSLGRGPDGLGRPGPPRPTKSKTSLGRGPVGLGRSGQPRPPKSKMSFGRGPAGPRRPGPPRLPKSSMSFGLGPARLARTGPPRPPKSKTTFGRGPAGLARPGPPRPQKSKMSLGRGWPGPPRYSDPAKNQRKPCRNYQARLPSRTQILGSCKKSKKTLPNIYGQTAFRDPDTRILPQLQEHLAETIRPDCLQGPRYSDPPARPLR